MKRTVALIMTFSMILLSLSGCAKDERKPLNIIDDNYRTWYEIFPYTFYDSDGDSIGDLKGIIEKLDYINDNNPDTDTDLGCNGIWLMPIMPSTTYHKYDVTDYYGIDKEYGTLDDFKQLIKECHDRGINVIIDLVMNHTSAKHNWFLTAQGYLMKLEAGQEPDLDECPYVGYYHFVRKDDAKGKYYQVPGTEWYYEANFWDQMPDLDLLNPLVRKEFEAVADFWLELGVDGFRLDAAKEFVSGSVNDNVEILSWFNGYVKSVKSDCYIVAEVWNEMASFAPYYESGIDSVFNYSYGSGNGKIAYYAKNADKGDMGTKFANLLVNTQETLSAYNPNYIDASFLNNHDNARASGYAVYDTMLVKFMGGLNIMMPGSSFIYYGEEIGMKGSGKKDENFRAPMLWSLTDTTGITRAPSGMDKQESAFEGADAQLKDKNSILNYYIKAIRLRNENPEIARGTVEAIEAENSSVAVTKRTYSGSCVYVIYNFSSTANTISLPMSADDYSEVAGFVSVTEEKPALKKDKLTIPAYGIVVIK